MKTDRVTKTIKKEELTTVKQENDEKLEPVEEKSEKKSENEVRPRRSTQNKYTSNYEPSSNRKSSKKKTKTLYCTLCPKKKSFTSKVLFNRHLVQEHGSKQQRLTVMCEICSAVLQSQKYFERHMKTRHPKVTKVYICDNCGRKFDHKDSLRIHMDRHRVHQILTCIICQKSYISRHTFRKHLKTHVEKHICTVCGLIFHQKSLLDNHFVSKHSDELPYKCNFCTRLFPTKISRNNHHYIAHKNNKTELNFKCNECNIYFEMKEELRIHSFIHFTGEIKTCHKCDQIFKTERLLKIHMQKHETKKSFQCTQCGDFFVFKTGLAKHLRLNRCKGAGSLGDEKFKLDEEKIAEIALGQLEEITAKIGKNKAVEELEIVSFDDFSDENSNDFVKNDENLEKDRLEIVKFKNFNVKKEEFSENSQIFDCLRKKNDIKNENEIKIEDENDGEKSKETRKFRKKFEIFAEVKARVGRAHLTYTCDFCGENIKFKKQIILHMKQHLKRYKCKECLESFRSRKKLVDHSVAVHNIKLQVVTESFTCEICSKKFDAKSTFEAHKLSHDDTARNHICSICSAAFKSVGNLRRHEATHAATRDFHCTSCPKSFKTKLALKIHNEAVHAAMKVFVNCGICKAIVQEKHLNQHIKNQHTEEGQEKPFECSVCNKTFRTLQQGERHYEAVHEPKDRGVVYLCPHCPDLQFFRQRDLKEHSFIHFEGPIYQCEICQKMFKTKRLLMIHRAVHNDVGGFPCKICDNVVFKTIGGRRKHMARVHADKARDKIEIDECETQELV